MLVDTSSMRADVAKDVAMVQAAHDAGLRSIAETQAAAALRSMRPLIDAWAKRGLEAASSGKPPSGNGWSGWQQAGQQFLAGIEDLAHLGKTATLTAIVDTLKAIPGNAPKDVAKAAGKVAAKTAAATTIVMSPIGSAWRSLTSLPYRLILFSLVLYGGLRLRAIANGKSRGRNYSGAMP